MFESIDLQVADETVTSTNQIVSFTHAVTCTRTGCYGTTCKYPC
jgi:hypothetical protein